MDNRPVNPDFSNRLTREPTTRDGQPTKRTSAEIVATELGWKILVRQYPPGARLREQELSSEFNVSRTVIRDVIGKLAARGFVEIHPWRGATVVSYTSDELADLLELNAMVYSMVARHAATRRGPEHLARMEQILELMTELATTAQTPEEFHITRVQFFGAMNDATGSFFTGRRRANFPLTFYHQHVLADALTPEQRLRQVEFFRTMLHLIREGAAQEAEQCCRDNFLEKRAVVMQSLKAEAEAVA